MPVKPNAPVDSRSTTQEIPRLHTYSDVLAHGAVAAATYNRPVRCVVTAEFNGVLLTLWRAVEPDAWVIVNAQVGVPPRSARDLLTRAEEFLKHELEKMEEEPK